MGNRERDKAYLIRLHAVHCWVIANSKTRRKKERKIFPDMTSLIIGFVFFFLIKEGERKAFAGTVHKNRAHPA